MSDHTKGTSMSTQIGQPGSAPRPGDSEVGSGQRPPNSIGKVVFA
jgi:hypothetical protein